MKTFKLFLTLSLTLFIMNSLSAQKIYNPNADAKRDITEAVAKAKKEGKHVLIQVGGNWCPWCIKMHRYLHNQEEINKLLNDNYVFLEVNYSKENKNKDVLMDLGYPQRFGFPVMLVLNAKGERIHTQNTGNLEKDKGYDFDRVKSFLYNWRPDTLNPANYK
ncbi:thioredoxin family protein [Marinifilum flexuosum]|uniref:Thioredoxin-like protein n=1 Tax=Marinifilum flexuosum TaxID=1117708 RepID=A0A419WT74_9BACT|nr:thioredoxin family protein [Marinifilum flexuosum]RKD98663.1 thioredoxin-like protein [Marinifilum flexuosum]